MDYLVYADLQLGRDQDASDVVSQLRSMPALDMRDFKIAYAATAIPIRYAVERADWKAASAITASPDAPPEVAAAAFWAQSLGFARSGRPSDAVDQLSSFSAWNSSFNPPEAAIGRPR